jgi:hypothetical protein
MALLGGNMADCTNFAVGCDEGIKKGEKKILSAIEAVVWYNGLGEFILPWRDKKPDDYSGYITPDYRDKEYDEGLVTQLEVIWMIAVMLYGNYGTSPRSGWIENIDGFKKFIDTITESYRQEEVD